MGFEIPLDVDYVDHPKTLRLIASLGKTADVYPLRLWCWAAKYAKNGVVSGGEREVEKAVRWTGEAGKCHKALVEAGFINRDGKTIHDWKKHAGRKIEQYERKKELQRQKYAADGEQPPDDSSENLPADCRNSSTMQGGSLPPLNEPNRNETKKEETTGNETARLAQVFTFDSGYGTDPKRIAIWHTTLSDLVRAGISFATIQAEYERPNRQRTEPPWEFQKRLMKTKADAGKDGFDETFRKSMKEQHGVDI